MLQKLKTILLQLIWVLGIPGAFIAYLLTDNLKFVNIVTFTSFLMLVIVAFTTFFTWLLLFVINNDPVYEKNNKNLSRIIKILEPLTISNLRIKLRTIFVNTTLIITMIGVIYHGYIGTGIMILMLLGLSTYISSLLKKIVKNAKTIVNYEQ